MESANRVPFCLSGYDAFDIRWVVPVLGLTDLAITTGRSEKMTYQTTLEGSLLAPYRFAEILLQNRIVMASMTRGRAKNAALVPTELHVDS